MEESSEEEMKVARPNDKLVVGAREIYNRGCITHPPQRQSCSTIRGGRGYDDSVPREVTKTTPSGDRTTGSPTWSASLPRIQLIPPFSWSDMSSVGAIFVPSPPKTGTNLLHPLSPQSLDGSTA